MDKFIRLFKFIVENGPWALLVIIMLTWLAADYGFLHSQAKVAADAIKEHTEDSKQTRKVLENIADILEEQRRLQAQSGLIACLKEAKADWQNTDCVRKFTINQTPKR